MTTGAVVWITGLPSSGKTTFAAAIQAELASKGVPSALLDSDEMREILHTHDYSAEGRAQFYTTLGDLAALLARQGIITLVAATAHRRRYRERARQASPRFLEVYVSTPVDECAKRDPKGLYARARAQLETELPGISVDYEPPSTPDVVASGGLDRSALDQVVHTLLSH